MWMSVSVWPLACGNKIKADLLSGSAVVMFAYGLSGRPPSVYTPYAPPIHPLYTPYTPPIHPLYTPYTPPIHPL